MIDLVTRRTSARMPVPAQPTGISILRKPLTFEALTTLDGPTVLARAKEFFAERVPLNAAFPET